MKYIQEVIFAAIVAAASAIDEPVASPTADIDRGLAEYERQLGTDTNGSTSGGFPSRSVSIVSFAFYSSLLGCERAA